MDTMIHPFKALGIGIAVMAILIILSFVVVDRQIEEAGGVKQILIDVGKDAKDIVKEVQEHE